MRIKHNLFSPKYVVDVVHNGFQIKELAKNGRDYQSIGNPLGNEQHVVQVIAQFLLTDMEGDYSPGALFHTKDVLLTQLADIFQGKEPSIEPASSEEVIEEENAGQEVVVPSEASQELDSQN